MDLNSIIEWCNNNEGFAMVLVSLGTLIVSIMAIIISISTSRLPFKKKVLVNTGTFLTIGNMGVHEKGIHVTAINAGNRNVRIITVGLYIDQIYINKETINESKVTLSVGDTTGQFFEYKTMFNDFKGLDLKSKVYGFVEDTEGKRYSKYIGRLGKILKTMK